MNAFSSPNTDIVIRWAPLYGDVAIPQYAEPGAAGRDIRAYLTGSKSAPAWSNVINEQIDPLRVEEECDGLPIRPRLVIPPMTRCIIPTGLRFVLKPGWEIQMRPRSGYIKSSLRMVNAPATLDCSYRGEVGLLLENISTYAPVAVEHHNRLAQLAVRPVAQYTEETLPPGLDLDEHFGSTSRGTGAFGSTGNQ